MANEPPNHTLLILHPVQWNAKVWLSWFLDVGSDYYLGQKYLSISVCYDGDSADISSISKGDGRAILDRCKSMVTTLLLSPLFLRVVIIYRYKFILDDEDGEDKPYLLSKRVPPNTSCVRIYHSVFPMRDEFEQIYNEITCVNRFPIFLTTLSFELQILNNHCDPNIQQNKIINFIWN